MRHGTMFAVLKVLSQLGTTPAESFFLQGTRQRKKGVFFIPAKSRMCCLRLTINGKAPKHKKKVLARERTYSMCSTEYQNMKKMCWRVNGDTACALPSFVLSEIHFFLALRPSHLFQKTRAHLNRLPRSAQQANCQQR